MLMATNKLPPYGLIHRWLGEKTVARLLNYVQSNEHLFEGSTVLHNGKYKVDVTQRISRKLKLVESSDLATELTAHVRHLFPTMLRTLGVQPFNPHKFELELVAHSDGAFFVEHIDTVTGEYRGDSDRIVSGVYYFHSLPKVFSGGALRLYSLGYDVEGRTFVDISPDNDMFVFFSSFFPHEVLTVHCPSYKFLDSRFAINLWIHRR